MKNEFHSKMDKIDTFAERSGNWLHKKISKILFGIFFGIVLISFGSLTFFSRFTRSLFGIKD